MRITSGKHKGKILEVVALRDPEFMRDLLLSDARGVAQRRLKAEARRLVETFDRRAFDRHCVGMGCERKATRCTFYKCCLNDPWWWCDACDPWQYGAGRDMIRIVRTYQDALDFSEAFGDPWVTQDLILTLAEAKGLPAMSRLRLKESQAEMFFNG